MRKLNQHTAELSLEDYFSPMALEGSFNVIELAAKAKQLYPKLLSALSDFKAGFASNVELEQELRGLSKERQSLVRIVRTLDFVDYSSTAMPVPENFKGNLNAYRRVLEESNSLLYGQLKDLVLEYKHTLTMIITDKTMRVHGGVHKNVYSKSLKLVETVSSSVNNFFPRNTGGMYNRLRDVVKNVSDLEEYVVKTGSGDLSEQRKILTEIQPLVTECSDLLNVLIQGNQRGEYLDMTAVAMADLSEGAYTIGKLIERASALYYEQNLFYAAYAKICAKIKKDHQ